MRFAKNKLLIFVLAIPIVGAVLFAIAVTATNLFIDAESIGKNLVEIGKESFKAKVEFEEIQYSPWSGIEIKGLSIRDATLKINDKLIDIDKILVEYSLAKLLIGKIEINRIMLIKPMVQAKCEDGLCNYDFFTNSSAKKHENKTVESDEPDIVKLLGYRSKVITPLMVSIDQIGIGQGSLSFEEKTKETRKLQKIENINFYLSLEAWLFSNKFTIKFPKKFGPLLLMSSERSKDQDEKTTTMSVEQDCGLGLKDLSNLDIRCSFSGKYLGNDLSLNPILVGLNTEIAVSNDNRNILVKKLDFKISEFVALNTKLDFGVEKMLQGIYPIQLDASMDINFNEIKPWLEAFRVPWSLSGRFTMPKVSVKGAFDLEKLKKSNTENFPVIESSFIFDDLMAASALRGFNMSPLNGSMNFGASNDLVSRELDVDFALDLKLSALSYFPKLESGGMKGAVMSDISLSGRSSASLPSARDGELNLQLKVESVKIIESNDKEIDQKFELNITSNLDKVTKSGIVKANIELGDAAKISASFNCRSNCEQADAVINSKLLDFDQIFRVLRPFIAIGSKELVLPTEIDGRGNLNTTVSISSTKPVWQATPADITNLDYTATVNLQEVSLRDPYRGLALDGSRTYFNLYGNRDKQSIVIDQRIKKLDSTKISNQSLALKDASLSLEIQNELSIQDLARKKLELPSTEVDIALFLGEVSFGDLITKPLKDLRAHILVAQEKAKLFKIKKLFAEIPELGMSVNSSAKFGLNKESRITDVDADLRLAMHNIKGMDLSDTTSLQGSVGLDLSVATPELDNVKISGDIALSDFSFEAGKSQKNKIEVRRANGNLPFVQNFRISQIQKALDSRGKYVDNQGLGLLALAEQYLERFKKLQPKLKSTYLSKEPTSGRSMFGEKTPLIFEKIRAGNLVFRKILLDLEIAQNWIKLNQFIFEFLGGRIQGSVGLAFNPLPIALKTDIHISRLNTRKLIEDFPNLRSKATSWALFASPFIDATLHIQHNMVSKDIEGQIDITSIGVEQLKMILYYIDPDEKDPSLRGLISMLDIGGVVADVDLVQIPIQNGLMDLDIDLNFLAAPLPIPKIERIPIGQLIDNYTSEAAPVDVVEDKSG